MPIIMNYITIGCAKVICNSSVLRLLSMLMCMHIAWTLRSHTFFTRPDEHHSLPGAHCTGLLQELARAARSDGCVRVRRRAQGTLGELLFYAATQQAGADGACAWVSPDAPATDAVAAALSPEEDLIVQASDCFAICSCARVLWPADHAPQHASSSWPGAKLSICNADETENLFWGVGSGHAC